MKKHRFAVLLALVLFVMCLACAVAQDEPAKVAEESKESAPAPAASKAPATPPVVAPAEYKLQIEDAIRVSVWGEPSLTVEQALDPQGFVNITLIGQIHAEGLTQKELTDKITKGLSKYLVEPKVQVTVLVFRKPKVYVVGQLSRPGLYELKPGDRVMEVIAQAGSFTDYAYLKGATLTHKGSKESDSLDLHKLFIDGDMSQNVELKDGDTIYIPEDTINWYYVLGEVMRPGKYRLKENVTVMDAITNAGDARERGSLKGTTVIRGDDLAKQAASKEGIQPEKIKVDITKLVKDGDISQNIALKPGDVVYVPETSQPNWQKIAGILSAIVNLSYIPRIWGL